MSRDRPSPGTAWAWHAAALAAVLVVPTAVRFGVLPWAVPAPHRPLVAALGATYALGAVLLVAAIRQGRRRTAPALIGGALAALFLGLLLAGDAITVSRSLLLIGAVLVAALLAMAGARAPGAAAPWLLAALTGGAAAWAVGSGGGGAAEGPVYRIRTEIVHADRIPIRIEHHLGLLPSDDVPGGGLVSWEGGFLLATGEGEVLRLRFDETDSLRIDSLGIRVPANLAAFAADSVGETWRFRVADLLVRPAGERVELLATHHRWFPGRRCFTLRLSALAVPRERLRTPDGDSTAAWRTVYDTRPCLPIADKGDPFSGQQAGGRLLPLGGDTLLLTVGDHGFDGTLGRPALPQDPESDYGKTLRLDLSSGTAETFTSGHRNPQGVARAGDGAIWSTEHGPLGGDELNLLVEGGNYGWPFETWGVDYGGLPWSAAAGEAGRLRRPRFAWTPAIGISALIAPEGRAFAEWRGDLLIASLRGRSLFRVKLQGDRPAFVEPLEIGRPIRDLAEGADGRIVLWTDDGTVVRLSPARSVTEAAVAFHRCYGCHQVGDGDDHGIGPDLRGVVGRPVAAVEDFAYSEALRDLGGVWTAERLDRFLSNPDSVAPGTRMAGQRIEDAGTRRALIAYLRSVSGDR